MARVPGFEPGTSRLGGGRSILLSYTRETFYYSPLYMARQPFVWEVQIRRDLIDDELAHLRDLPYSVWTAIIGRPRTKAATGRDGRTYKIRMRAEWADPRSKDVRVTLRVYDFGWRRKPPIEGGFVITPENRFVG